MDSKIIKTLFDLDEDKLKKKLINMNVKKRIQIILSCGHEIVIETKLSLLDKIYEDILCGSDEFFITKSIAIRRTAIEGVRISDSSAKKAKDATL